MFFKTQKSLAQEIEFLILSSNKITMITLSLFFSSYIFIKLYLVNFKAIEKVNP